MDIELVGWIDPSMTDEEIVDFIEEEPQLRVDDPVRGARCHRPALVLQFRLSAEPPDRR